MKLTLYLVTETEKARFYARKPAAMRNGQVSGFWIPRSVCPRTTKYPAQPGEFPRHEVEVEDWFYRKNLAPAATANSGAKENEL